MKKSLVFLCLFLGLVTSFSVRADDSDPLKGISIYPRPQTFEDAQKMALQNRQDRLVLVQTAIACIQQASTVEDIAKCQADEGKQIAVIRVTYCDTDMSWGSVKRMRQQQNAQPTDGMAGMPPPKSTECQKAIRFLTGNKE